MRADRPATAVEVGSRGPVGCVPVEVSSMVDPIRQIEMRYIPMFAKLRFWFLSACMGDRRDVKRPVEMLSLGEEDDDIYLPIEMGKRSPARRRMNRLVGYHYGVKDI